MSNKIIFAFMLVFLMLSNCVSARCIPSEVSFDKTIRNNNLDREENTGERTPLADVPLTKRAPSSNSSNSGFSWKNLLPNHFGEFFEIFVFFMELKWHYEFEELIVAVGHRISEDVHTNMHEIETTETDGGRIETNEIVKSLVRAKYIQYYLNAMAPVYASHSMKSKFIENIKF